MNTNTDLLAVKTQEYSKLPGLILGLDGWILRSLPAEHRSQFLTSYEKILRIVFHPDRYSDPEKKKSRERYLQNVNEAVRYMLSDTFAYEMTAETVPSHKNPLFILQNSIDVRDAIISRLDDEKQNTTSSLAEANAKIQNLTKQVLQLNKDSEHQSSRASSLQRAISKVTKGYPVPVGLRSATLTGRFFPMIQSYQASRSHNFIQRLCYYSSVGQIHESGDFLQGWGDMIIKEKLASPPHSIHFERSIGVLEGKKLRMIAAMTLAHLCEFIRSFTGFKNEILSFEEILKAIKYLSRTLVGNNEREKFRQQIYPYSISFFSPQMLVILQHRESSSFQHELFLVESVDAGINPHLAELHGLEYRLEESRKECTKERNSKNTLAKKLSALRLEHERLLNKASKKEREEGTNEC